ncbi:MAG: thiamine phosphate synthase [Thermoleophilaceae bacterium]
MAARLRTACDEHGALLWVNDRPDLALGAGADGVHVGQDDMLGGRGAPRGRRRHADRPVHPLARPARGRHRRRRRPAQRRARCGRPRPSPAARRQGWTTCASPHGAGHRRRGSPSAASTRRTSERWWPPEPKRIVVVRAVRDAPDAGAAAARLRAALEESSVGAAQ